MRYTSRKLLLSEYPVHAFIYAITVHSPLENYKSNNKIEVSNTVILSQYYSKKIKIFPLTFINFSYLHKKYLMKVKNFIAIKHTGTFFYFIVEFI